MGLIATTKMPHLQAMKHAIGDVWKERASAVVSQYVEFGNTEDWVLPSPHQLLFGSASSSFENDIEEHSQYSKLRSTLENGGLGSLIKTILPFPESRGCNSFNGRK